MERQRLLWVGAETRIKVRARCRIGRVIAYATEAFDHIGNQLACRPETIALHFLGFRGLNACNRLLPFQHCRGLYVAAFKVAGLLMQKDAI